MKITNTQNHTHRKLIDSGRTMADKFHESKVVPHGADEWMLTSNFDIPHLESANASNFHKLEEMDNGPDDLNPELGVTTHVADDDRGKAVTTTTFQGSIEEGSITKSTYGQTENGPFFMEAQAILTDDQATYTDLKVYQGRTTLNTVEYDRGTQKPSGFTSDWSSDS
jgi:hypothetical protein